MIYTKQTKTAIRLMFEAHKDQRDKSGLPYVFHPFHVAETMEDEVTCTAALLHDILEDTDTTPQELLEAGISPEAVRIVQLLTHPQGEEYLDYVRRIGRDPGARAVKISDLRHNSDLTRLDRVEEKDIRRVEKYRLAIEILEGMEQEG